MNNNMTNNVLVKNSNQSQIEIILSEIMKKINDRKKNISQTMSRGDNSDLRKIELHGIYDGIQIVEKIINDINYELYFRKDLQRTDI